MTPRAYLWFFAIVALWATIALAWPAGRPNIQWHQTCVYAMLPDGTVNAFPGNPCDRDTWKL